MGKDKFIGVGTGMIIRKDDQILLLRRKNVHGAGSWSTPGGHIDFGETPEACAIREVKEETGLDICNPRYLGITNDVFLEADRHYITLWFTAEYAGGEPQLNAPYESDAVGWFAWENMPQPLFLSLQHLVNGDSYPSRAFKDLFEVSDP